MRTPEDGPPGAGATTEDAPRWLPFSIVTSGYLAVTVAESILAPALPEISRSLGLGLGMAGLAIGAMTGAIAAGNFVGGYLLARSGSRVTLMTSLLVCVVGCGAVVVTGQLTGFLIGQVLIGLGVGSFFPPGLQAAGFHAGGRRKGLAMGLFGVAFSGGLTIAALLVAIGAELDWRLAFVVAGLLCLLGVVALARTPLPPTPTGPPGGYRRPLRDALGVPVVAGSIASVCQYGTIGFLPTYAVLSWGMSPAMAAVLLAVGRALSVPGKLLGGAASDRFGAHRALVGLGAVLTATGLAWTLLPPVPLVVTAAAVFIATVSAVFPVANVLALEDFGDRGPLLGTFRSVQIGVGAAGAWLVGVAATQVGLTLTLTATVLLPLGLCVLRPLRTRLAAAEAP
jgi:predicted MFS family arabinose efflux permease